VGGVVAFAAYLAAAKLGLVLAFIHASASAVWPPTGIAIAIFLVLGSRMWPAIFSAAFVANVTTAGSVATSLGIALGNTLEGLLAAALVTRFAGGRHVFERPEDVVKYAALAGLGSTMVSATAGVTSLALGGYAAWADYQGIWFTWWLGDAVGAIVVAPCSCSGRTIAPSPAGTGWCCWKPRYWWAFPSSAASSARSIVCFSDMESSVRLTSPQGTRRLLLL
jgi:integral membrane sensor domain MASE1